MEKTVLEQKETYVDSVHRWGRIWGLTLLVLIVAYPIAVSLIFHAQVNWPAFIKGFIAIGPMYWAVGIVEIFTYVPMLGAGGGYLAFITGNLINMKIPCAVNARDLAGVKTGTAENEIVSTLSIATSSLVTIVILALGVLALQPLQPVLQSPALQPAFAKRRPGPLRRDGVSVLPQEYRRSHCAAGCHERSVHARAGADLVHQLYDHPLRGACNRHRVYDL